MKTLYRKNLSYLYLSKQRGFSLIELMVGLVIGLLMSLVVFSALNVNEGRKRTTNSLNDINQAGSYTIYQLDKLVRSAGSGFTGGGDKAGADFAFSCKLSMAREGTQLTPATAAFPAPFNSVANAIRVAPVIIYDEAAGSGGDVIVTMAGSAGLGESPTSVVSLPTKAATLNLLNHAGTRAGDIVLLANSGASVQDCLTQQVAPAFDPKAGLSEVTLAGDYYSASVNAVSAADFAAGSQVINLGQEPSFIMATKVGGQRSLF